MQVNQDSELNAYTIRSYHPGEISITPPAPDNPTIKNAKDIIVLTSSFIISPNTLTQTWAPENIETLVAEHLKAIIELNPEVVLIGTGQKLEFPETSILTELHRQQIGVEIMDTAAACRTYNILMMEGRDVVAGMIHSG